MALMILSHPRSKSTLMSDCFHNSLGEIFNIQSIDPKSFERIPWKDRDRRSCPEIWAESWTRSYLDYIEEKLTESPNVTFKVFMGQLMDCPSGLSLVKKINPRVLHIYRKNSLNAIKSYLIAEKRGYSKASQISIDPFEADLNSFYTSYEHCVVHPALSRSFFKIEWQTTYEDFDPKSFPYAERVPAIQIQNSEEIFSTILNESQVNDWYRAVRDRQTIQGDLLNHWSLGGST